MCVVLLVRMAARMYKPVTVRARKPRSLGPLGANERSEKQRLDPSVDLYCLSRYLLAAKSRSYAERVMGVARYARRP